MLPIANFAVAGCFVLVALMVASASSRTVGAAAVISAAVGLTIVAVKVRAARKGAGIVVVVFAIGAMLGLTMACSRADEEETRINEEKARTETQARELANAEAKHQKAVAALNALPRDAPVEGVLLACAAVDPLPETSKPRCASASVARGRALFDQGNVADAMRAALLAGSLGDHSTAREALLADTNRAGVLMLVSDNVAQATAVMRDDPAKAVELVEEVEKLIADLPPNLAGDAAVLKASKGVQSVAKRARITLARSTREDVIPATTSSNPTEQIADGGPPHPGYGRAQTDLSRKADQLHDAARASGRSLKRVDYVAALGPPTWVLLYGDKNELAPDLGEAPVSLWWENGKACGPVSIDIDNDDTVVGTDLGFSCDEEMTTLVLADIRKSKTKYGCSQAKRTRYCAGPPAAKSTRQEAESILAELKALLTAGKSMQALRRNGREAECGNVMRANQARAASVRARAEVLPDNIESFERIVQVLLTEGAIHMNVCVSCLRDAIEDCSMAERSLRDVGPHISKLPR